MNCLQLRSIVNMEKAVHIILLKPSNSMVRDIYSVFVTDDGKYRPGKRTQ